MSPEELTQTLEFSALLQSGETGDLQTVLQMVEAVVPILLMGFKNRA